MAHRCEFYLYKRKMKKGSYWYVCYLDKETGKQQTAKSIDVLKEKLGYKEFEATKRRDDAVIIAKKALDKGLIFNKEKEILLNEYLLNFWDYEKSEYINRRNSYKENSICKEYAANMLYAVKKHVVPFFSSDFKIQNLKTSHLDCLLESLLNSSLSKASIKSISYSFLIPLKEAERKGLIDNNPAHNMLEIWKTDSRRGALTKEETKAFIVELKSEEKHLNKSYYLALLLAFSTGLRSGEIRALNIKDLESTKSEAWTKVIIKHSVGRLSGIKTTKGKYERAVLIPTSLANGLKRNADASGLCLPSPYKRKKYISPPTLRNIFYSLLEKIGIDKKLREERKITFHSIRHTFSTLGRDALISQEDRMIVLGHKSKEVNNRYTHISEDALFRVSKITSELLSPIINAEKSEELGSSI